ncbi:MAG: hypothetical protein NTW28_04475, partial [Candidatus Solibacter sp.]|nr:hypothetical protein [Candidatus Solibacter sp.]
MVLVRLVLSTVIPAMSALAGQQPEPPLEQSQTAASEPGKKEAAGQPKTDLNLLGRTDTEGGESRRNENVQFNLIDNNALKELNIRLGITPTIVGEFRPDGNYFGTEYANAPAHPPHLTRERVTG